MDGNWFRTNRDVGGTEPDYLELVFCSLDAKKTDFLV